MTNRKESFSKAHLVYRICCIGRWITGGVAIFFVIRLLWKQNRVLNFIADHAGDEMIITDLGPSTVSLTLFTCSIVLTVVLSVASIILKKKNSF